MRNGDMSKNKSSNDYQSLFESEDEKLEKDQEEALNRSKSGEFSKLLATAAKPKVGSTVKAEILVMGKEDIFLSLLDDSGKPGPYEGVLSRMELKNIPGAQDWKTGEKVELVVTKIFRKDGNEEIRLGIGRSRSAGAGASGPSPADLKDLEDAFDFEQPVEGRVAEVCNGGFRVALKGQSGRNLAFCPISQLGLERIETPETHVGFRGDFLITKFEEGGKNIIVSRRKLLQRENEMSQGSFLAENPVGTTVLGTVKRLENFGAFVELAPSLEGLLHISEISFSRIGHPSDVLQVGQKILVKLLKNEQKDGKMRISLSAKQAEGASDALASQGAAAHSGPSSHSPSGIRDPFSEWAQKFPTGSVCEGTVDRKEGFGWFVKLAPSVTGLLHKSRVEGRHDVQWDKWKPGEKLTVEIGEIQLQERRISLALPKDPSEEDWQEYQRQQQSVAQNDSSNKSKSGSFGGAFGSALSQAFAKSAGGSEVKQDAKKRNKK